jgi:nucleoside-diphosphate kinase
VAGNVTFSIIKPDAVSANNTGKILDAILAGGFKIRAMKLVQLTPAAAGAFYAVHKERPFYNDLVAFMTSGPCVPLVLEKENAVEAFRTLIGSTDPTKAAEGTIRKQFAQSIQNNAIHGSDADTTAAQEIAFFFSQLELVG